jgi:hypothetical protein
MEEKNIDTKNRESSLGEFEHNLELITDATEFAYAGDGKSVTLSGFRNNTKSEPKTLGMNEVAEVFDIIFSGSEDEKWYRFKIDEKKHSVLKESVNAKLVFSSTKYKSD